MGLYALLIVTILLMLLMFIASFYFTYKNRLDIIDNRNDIKRISTKLDGEIVKLTSSFHKLSTITDYNDVVLRSKQIDLESIHSS